MAVNKLLQEEKEDKQKEKKQLYFIFAGCIVLLLLVVSGILRMQRSKQLKRKPSGRTDTGKYAAEKAAERFADQLIQLAEINSPSFWHSLKKHIRIL